MHNLALQVGQVDRIEVSKYKLTHTGSRQVQGDGAAKATKSLASRVLTVWMSSVNSTFLTAVS